MRPIHLPAALPLFVTFAGLILGGCDRQAAKPAGAEELTVSLSSPENAAKTVLSGLRAMQLAAAAQDDAAVKRLRETVGQAAAAEVIDKSLSPHPRIKYIIGDDIGAGIVRNWASTTAYYAGGAHFERMFRVAETQTTVTLVVPATGADDEALIQINCNRCEDDLWRVSQLKFVTEAEPLAPASQPAP